MDKPRAERREASWLEVDDAARFREAARSYQSRPPHAALGSTYAIVATFLLTGGRESESLALEISDVSFA